MASQPKVHTNFNAPAPADQRKPTPEPPKSATSSRFSSVPSQLTAKRAVVTVPPWAKDEQPVPDEDVFLNPSSANRLTSTSSHERMPSDIASFTSSGGIPEQPHSGNWWTFAVPRRTRPVIEEEGEGSSPTTNASDFADLEKAGARTGRRRISKPRPKQQRNRSSWIFGYALGSVNPTKVKDKRSKEAGSGPAEDGNVDETSSSSDEDEDEDEQENHDEDGDEDDRPNTDEEMEQRDGFDDAGPSSTLTPRFRRPRRASSNILRLDLPLPPAPFTKAQTETPGWDSPWNPRKYLPEPESAVSRDRVGASALELNRGMSLTSANSYRRTGTGLSTKRPKSRWQRRKLKFRKWCLHNLYVPLLFRIINLAFTSATLGVAVGIRRSETKNGALGILGSSSTVTIIFAPLTLVHVLISIYLEYFGRPVGLWKTSAKLAYTLLEVVLICAWAAALALCFNDYFTTALECGPKAIDRWWSAMPRTPNPLAEQMREGQAGEEMCEEQLALICVAFVTLTSYCCNLVIALFRIIEKVKNYSARPRMY